MAYELAEEMSTSSGWSSPRFIPATSIHTTYQDIFSLGAKRRQDRHVFCKPGSIAVMTMIVETIVK